MTRRLLGILLVVAALAGAGASRAALRHRSADEPAAPALLYLPNGKYLRAVSLGHAGLVADAVYLWAIQYYSDYQRSERYRYVEHVFGDVIAELDPHFVDPYWLGALILIVEARDLEGGLRLLDRGFARNPDQWILPYMAAFECYRAKDYDRAARYLDAAARVKDAPAVVLRMKAGMLARAGDTRDAVALWKDVADDPRSDAGVRAMAEARVRDLTVALDLRELHEAVERFRTARGRFPGRLADLVVAGAVDAIPLDPDGKAYAYDSRTGTVTSAAGRILGPS